MTAAQQRNGRDLHGAEWALEAIRSSLQEKVERADWALRTVAEREGRTPRQAPTLGLLHMNEQVYHALNGARSSAEIYANHPLPGRDRARREEETAALGDRVQTAMDNETRPAPGFRQLTVRFRAEEAALRAHGRQHPTPAVPTRTTARARTSRARGEEGRP